MDRAERAAMLHREGYNCCQAVACVFADAVGVDEALLYRIGEGFGAGMGTGRGVCGAVSGAAMIAGLAFYRRSPFGDAAMLVDVDPTLQPGGAG